MLQEAFKFIDDRREQSIAGLVQFLRIPSVSAQPAHAGDVARCADWLAERFRELGLWAKVEPTPGHPVVMAGTERKAGRPTVLLYGHYDVQPPEPLEQWTSPPFDPTVRNGAICARGAADDKGQIWAHVEAVRAWQQQGGLPVNLICLIEGEEEIGSDHLSAFMEQHKDELAGDIAVISDTGQFARGVPAITYGLRGLVYMEVFLNGPSHDLHSGIYGGAVANPANVLAEMLGSLHDANGRVTIPGFYDDVLPLTPAERQAWAGLPFDEREFAAELGVDGLQGEAGYTAIERKWARPTCDINGLTSGYQGQGAKTIIPAQASAKVSMRLVPRQDPVKIQAAFEKMMCDHCPAGIRIKFAQHGGSPASMVPLDSPAMILAGNAMRAGFGRDPVFMREGGSIPVVGHIKRILGMDTLLVGFGLPDDRIHSPNEKFDLDALFSGTKTAVSLYAELAKLSR